VRCDAAVLLVAVGCSEGGMQCLGSRV
jgi:hypothetical protein